MMQETKQARLDDQAHSKASRGGELPIQQENSLVDNRAVAVRQHKLADAMTSGPRMAAQQTTVNMINQSPRAKAFRTHIVPVQRATVQRQAMRGEEDVPQDSFKPVQHLTTDEDVPVQGKFAADNETPHRRETKTRPNMTGLPETLKTGIESLSGISMDNVKVHYNSCRPVQLNALAYAQGTDIHLAPGQEKHLPHEAWHVVQQAQGRVKPTLQMAGAIVNDEQGLEREADAMGSQATAGVPPQLARESTSALRRISHAMVAQRKISYAQGQFASEEALLDALYKVFKAYGEKAKELIKYFVKEYEKVGGHARYASEVFNLIAKENMPERGYKPTFAVIGFTESGTKHGPRMPEKVDRCSNPDKTKALSTFNFPQVTLGRLTVFSGGTEISFHDRQTEGMHAEDNLLEQLEGHIKANEIDTSNLKINLTINNFFCTKKTTTKSKGKLSCLEKIIGIQKTYKFRKFHVYFANPYGDVSLMSSSIEELQNAGISVSSFSPTENKVPYLNNLLDDHSGSEDDSDNEEEKTAISASSSTQKDKKKASPGKRKRESSEPVSSRTRSASAIGSTDIGLPDATPRHFQLDGIQLFEECYAEFSKGRVILNGYQIAKLIEQFGPEPWGNIVTFNNAEFKIHRLEKALRKTEYNPDGLALGLQRFLRGG